MSLIQENVKKTMCTKWNKKVCSQDKKFNIIKTFILIHRIK